MFFDNGKCFKREYRVELDMLVRVLLIVVVIIVCGFVVDKEM